MAGAESTVNRAAASGE